MAKITISSIAIENFGPFRERQSLNLQVRSKRPVILVKALNGSGKTTLLTALQIGLYGHRAVGGMRRSGYEKLVQGLQRSDAVGGSSIEVDVELEMAGARRALTVRRAWTYKADTLNEELTVFEGGTIDVDFSQKWEEFITAILPAELVELFFFDGEKIEALASPDRLPELLRRATEVFLGIGGIDALGHDLKALERRTQLKNKNTSAEYEVARINSDALERQVKELEEQLDVIAQQRADIRKTFDQAQDSLEKFSSEAKRRGLLAYEQAAVIQQEAFKNKQRAEDARTHLAETMSDPVLPVAWLSDLWPQYRSVWEQDQHARHATLLAQEFKSRDKRIMSLVASTLPKASAEVLRKALINDLRHYSTTSKSKQVAMQDAPPNDIERQLRHSQGQLQRDMSELETALSDLERTELSLDQIPADEQMSQILHTLQERSKNASAAETRLVDMSRRFDEAHSKLTHLRIKLNAAQERMRTEFQDRSIESKSLEAAARARQAMTVFKARLLASKAHWLSNVITAEFRNLLRKKNLIKKVIVDPDTYRVSIIDGKHQGLSMDRLSAGERQLLAISVLSALIKERKGRFPVVVDTPLARLDQHHRSSLVQRFFATVSHQVVILSTDQEVDGPAYDALKPFTAAEYSLEFDDAIGATTIQARSMEEFA
jgi:DNA sulfur modification protein DndD